MKFKLHFSSIRLFVSSFIGLLFLYACGSKTEVFTWRSLEVSNFNAQTNQSIPANTTINARDYGIRMELSIGSLGSRNSSGGAIGKNTSFNDRIDSVQITSLQDFNDSLKAGIKLNRFFLARFAEGGTKVPLDTLIRRKRSELLFTQKNEAIENIELFLNQSPKDSKSMRFIVRLFLNFERTLRDTTDAVILRK
jgi:hypothetical protein